jgi:hypothetical protein
VFDVYFRGYAEGISFDSIELKNPEPFTMPKRPLINSVILESGKQSIQASPETAFAGTFKCHTEIHTNVTDLYAKIGTKANLVVDEYTYANCYISSFSELQWFKGKWNYEVSFVQETA